MKHLVAIALAAIILTPASAQKKHNDSWKLVWEENFDGSTLDSSVWHRIPRGRPDWKNTQSDTATGLVEVSDGKLHLYGRVNDYCPSDTAGFLTGGVWTKGLKAIPAGRIEVCAKLSNARGAWPAIWAMGNKKPWPACGEIDIMERLNGDAFAHQTLHSPYTQKHKKLKHGATGPINNGEFNVYGVDIEKDSIIFHINGVRTMTYLRDPKLEAEGQFPYFQDQYLILDMQLGGKWVGKVFPEDLPAEMQIDWVRAYVRDTHRKKR